MKKRKESIELPYKIRPVRSTPIIVLIFLGSLGIFAFAGSFVLNKNGYIPGVFFTLLALIFFFGGIAYGIELTETKLVYKELGRKKEILYDEIARVEVKDGFDTFRETFTKPKIRTEIHHKSDSSKNIYINSNIGIFSPKEFRKMFSVLRKKGIIIAD